MAHKHLNQDEIKRLLQTELSQDRAEASLRLLLTGCQKCLARLDRALSQLDREGEAVTLLEDDIYGPAFSKALALVEGREEQVKRENAEAPHLWERIRDGSRTEMTMRVASQEKYQTWGFASFLTSEARSLAARGEVGTALEAADLALLVIQLLDASRYKPALLADATCEAYLEVGNSLRVCGQFEPAATALERATREIANGSGDPQIIARLQSIRASLATDLGSFEDAAEYLRIASKVHREINDYHEYGRMLIQQSGVLRHFDPQAGVDAAKEGLESINQGDTLLHLIGLHNLADCLNEAGRLSEASSTFAEFSGLLAEVNNPVAGLRARWLAARINASIFHSMGGSAYWECAVAQLDGLSDEFVELEMYQPAALCDLQMVELLVLRGRYDHAIEIARQAITVLRSKHINLDAIQAWIMVEKAVAARSLDHELAAKVETLFRRHWNTRMPH